MTAPAGTSRAELARRLISLTDLTSLNEGDDAAAVRALAALARAAPLEPAALCIWARGIPTALEALAGTGIAVCAVANFPGGTATADAASAATRTARIRAAFARVTTATTPADAPCP